MTKNDDKQIQPSAIGIRLKTLRKENNWTLSEVASKTGISVGTLSKLENGKTELNFTSVNKIAEGLGLLVTQLTNPPSPVQGRRAVTIGGNGVVFHTSDMDYEVLCSDVSNHQQGYLKGTVKTFKFDPEAAWHRHEGQEFLFVLKGILELHTEFYNPLTLNQGDSILFDSSMGHHYVSLGDESAEILITMSLEGYQNISDTLFTFKTKNPKK